MANETPTEELTIEVSVDDEIIILKAELEHANTTIVLLSGQLAAATAERDALLAAVKENSVTKQKLYDNIAEIDVKISKMTNSVYEVPAELTSEEGNTITKLRQAELDVLKDKRERMRKMVEEA